MRKILLAACATMTIAATPANAATQWWYLNFADATCMRGAPGTVTQSPDTLSLYMRGSGKYRNTEIVRNNDGAIIVVRIEVQGGMEADFFTTQKACTDVLAAGLQSGEIVDPKELR